VVDDNSVSKLVDFGAYSRRMASAHPSGINKESYTPSHTALQECATMNSKWAAAASPLPPTPNPGLCDCVTDATGCMVADSVPSSEYGQLFELVCGMTDCGDIIANSTEGKYGDYSMCGPKQQLNIVLDKYYQEQGSDSSACHFDGAAVTKVASRSREDCNSVAETNNTFTMNGTETVSPEESETSSGAPCSCTCYCMGMDSLNSTRAFAGRAQNLFVAPGSFQFALSVVIAIVTCFGLVLL
jgi:hypothetical protein